MLIVVFLDSRDLSLSIEFSSHKLFISYCVLKLMVQEAILVSEHVGMLGHGIQLLFQVMVAVFASMQRVLQFIDFISHYVDLGISIGTLGFEVLDVSSEAMSSGTMVIVFLPHSVVSINFIIKSALKLVLIMFGLADIILQTVDFMVCRSDVFILIINVNHSFVQVCIQAINVLMSVLDTPVSNANIGVELVDIVICSGDFNSEASSLIAFSDNSFLDVLDFVPQVVIIMVSMVNACPQISQFSLLSMVDSIDFGYFVSENVEFVVSILIGYTGRVQIFLKI